MKRSILSSRIRAGLNRARRKGRKLGRPRLKVSHVYVFNLHLDGQSMREIGRELGISAASVSRIVRNAKSQDAMWWARAERMFLKTKRLLKKGLAASELEVYRKQQAKEQLLWLSKARKKLKETRGLLNRSHTACPSQEKE